MRSPTIGWPGVIFRQRYEFAVSPGVTRKMDAFWFARTMTMLG